MTQPSIEHTYPIIEQPSTEAQGLNPVSLGYPEGLVPTDQEMDQVLQRSIPVGSVLEWLLTEDRKLEEEAHELAAELPTVLDSPVAKLDHLGKMALVAGRRRQIKASVNKLGGTLSSGQNNTKSEEA